MAVGSESTSAGPRWKPVAKWLVRPVTRPWLERLHAVAVRQDDFERRTSVLENQSRASNVRSQRCEQRLDALELRVTELGTTADRLFRLEEQVVAFEERARRIEDVLQESSASAARMSEVLEVVSAQHALSRQNRRELDTLARESQEFVSEARQQLNDLLEWKKQFTGSDPSLH